jgi:enoyl-CoA hydratase/carnithine racemase
MNVLRRSLSSAATSDVVVESQRHMRLITLNRAKKLNALTLEMVDSLERVYREVALDHTASLAVLRGAGHKAFCAGGDVVSVVNAGTLAKGNSKEHRFPTAFFRTEYHVDHAIATLNKPHVALIDGITMGGGVGVSVHGRFRVATERSTFAMPETAIGLFPDVGGSWFLPRLPVPGLGFYLALTGAKLSGGAALRAAGIATHATPSEALPQLVSALGEVRQHASVADVRAVLDRFDTVPHGEVLSADVRAKVADVFGDAAHASFQQVWQRLLALEARGDEWAAKTVQTIRRMSPTSVRVTFEQLRRGAKLAELGDAFEMEFTLVQHALRGHDFYEGVRALLIDADQKPVWKPATLDDVSDAAIDKWFVHQDDFEQLRLPRKVTSAAL